MADLKTYYVKIRPTNGGKWKSTVAYDFWTTVFHETTGNSYLSIQDVPVGTEITDTSYWTLYSVNDARYEYLLGLIKNIQSTGATSDELEAIKTQLTSLIAASGETDGNTELQDIRVGADGTVYDTAGEAVRQQLKAKADVDDVMSWNQWFDLHRTGWQGGVEYTEGSLSVLGTKTGDNADLVIEASTNTTAGRDDYVGNLLFDGIVCNGYIDDDGHPHITAVEGSSDFAKDGSNGDVWVAFLTGFYNKEACLAGNWDWRDTPADGYLPEPHAVRADGNYDSFYFVSKYPGVEGPDGLPASISGKAPLRKTSHNNQIAEFRSKGNQYCGFTTNDVFWAQWQYEMKYASRNSASNYTGAVYYFYQYPATVEEDDVKRIIISSTQAANLVVGSYVSIGYGYVSGGAIGTDRQQDDLHAYADDVQITAIEEYDDSNSAVYVDAEESFSTAEVTLSDGLTSPVYLSTMHWWSGSCDDVLGADGSPSSPKSSKEPFLLSKVEFGHGGLYVISDLILSGVYDSDADTFTLIPYICDDSEALSTEITDDYTELDIVIPDTNSTWKYISEESSDERRPWAKFPTAVEGSTSTGYADGLFTGDRITRLQEALWFGHLTYTSGTSGLWCLNTSTVLTGNSWYNLRRLSLTIKMSKVFSSCSAGNGPGNRPGESRN